MCRKTALLVVLGLVGVAAARRASSGVPPAPGDGESATPKGAAEPKPFTGEVYRLSPGDTILIFVAERPDLSTRVRIPLEGTIILPGAGSIEAAGHGVEELSSRIARRLQTEARLVDPRVAVSVVEYRPRRAFVYGEVTQAKAVELPAERPLTLTQAISSCGGFKAEADRERVRVTRRKGGGRPKVFEVDAQKIAEGSTPELDPVLEQGDTIYVPRREPVYILGEVESPGALPVPYGYPLTVSKAVSIAGGWGKYASYKRVKVSRRGKEGTEIFTVDLGAVVQGKLDEDMEVKPGDTIYVPQRIF